MSLETRRTPPSIAGTRSSSHPFGRKRLHSDAGSRTWSDRSRKASTDVIVSENRNADGWYRPDSGQTERNLVRNRGNDGKGKAADPAARVQTISHSSVEIKPSPTTGTNLSSHDVQPQSGDLSLVHGRLSFTKNGKPIPNDPPRIVSACFGGLLDLHCISGEIIRILDNYYGHNDDGTCSYAKGGCFRRPNRGFGIAEQTCNTKTSCSNLQVTRVMCGEGYTNYQQIVYECIPG